MIKNAVVSSIDSLVDKEVESIEKEMEADRSKNTQNMSTIKDLCAAAKAGASLDQLKSIYSKYVN